MRKTTGAGVGVSSFVLMLSAVFSVSAGGGESTPRVIVGDGSSWSFEDPMAERQAGRSWEYYYISAKDEGNPTTIDDETYFTLLLRSRPDPERPAETEFEGNVSIGTPWGPVAKGSVVTGTLAATQSADAKRSLDVEFDVMLRDCGSRGDCDGISRPARLRIVDAVLIDSSTLDRLFFEELLELRPEYRPWKQDLLAAGQSDGGEVGGAFVGATQDQADVRRAVLQYQLMHNPLLTDTNQQVLLCLAVYESPERPYRDPLPDTIADLESSRGTILPFSGCKVRWDNGLIVLEREDAKGIIIRIRATTWTGRRNASVKSEFNDGPGGWKEYEYALEKRRGAWTVTRAQLNRSD